MNNALWILLTVLASAGAIVSLYFMTRKLTPALVSLDKGFRMPDMRLHYDAQTLFDCFAGVGADGQRLMERYWRTDFGFIACFLAIMVIVTRNNVSIAFLKPVMYAAAALRAVLDATENLIFLRVSAAYPLKRLDRLANVGGYVTTVKFAMLGIWLLGLFASLLLRGMAMGR